MSILKFLYLSLITLLIVFSFSSLNLAVASEDVADSAIKMAETAMISAYEALIEAEQAGGNISGLLTQLNEAGDFLALARMSYRTGDFDNAARFANLSRNIGGKVESEAYELRNSARNQKVQGMWFTMAGSISGVTLVILGSVWFWRFFKGWYFRRVLKMKPEVAKDES